MAEVLLVGRGVGMSHLLVSVLYIAGCQELVNPWCSLVTLTRYLKQRAQVPTDGKEIGVGVMKEGLRAQAEVQPAQPLLMPSQQPLPSWLRTGTWSS